MIHAMSAIRCERGAVHLPSLIIVTYLALCGLGGWSLLVDWRKQTFTQLRLNKCVGTASQRLQTTMRQIDSTNAEIRSLRAQLASLSSPAEGGAEMAGTSGAGDDFSSSPEVEKIWCQMEKLADRQDELLASWDLFRNEWASKKGCLQKSDIADLLPKPNFTREPPDVWGTQPLKEVAPLLERFQIRATCRNRTASAILRKHSNQWEAAWN
jgi:hypothetical protein